MTEKEILHVISAYKEGYRIESRPIESVKWQDDINPTWNFEKFEYRVKLVPEDMTKAVWQMAEYPMNIPALVECNKEIHGTICGVPSNGFSQKYYEIRNKVEPGEYYISLYSIENLPKKYHEELTKKDNVKNKDKNGKLRFSDIWHIFS